MSEVYSILRNFFEDHPNMATSLTARVMELLLEDEEGKEQSLEFLRGIRTESDNYRLVNTVTKIELVEHFEVDALPKNEMPQDVTDNTNYDRFEGSKSELQHIKQYFEENDFVVATHTTKKCEILSKEKTPEFGRFIKNGRAYETTFLIRVKERCPDIVEQSGEILWKVHESTYRTAEITWKDGNTKDKPPTLPRPYKKHAWDNRCPVFASPMGQVTSDWGWRQEPEGEYDFHPGIDLGVEVGTPVFATHTGKVRLVRHDAKNEGNGGVWIENGTDLYVYWHVNASVSKDDIIAAGQQIGVTGNYHKPHLHYARYKTPQTWHGDPPVSWSFDPCP